MIEILLDAERNLTAGRVDRAEQLYRQAADADPRNSIAVVGLARVAVERGDDRAALDRARQALAIDPENAAAQRLATRLVEILSERGEMSAAGGNVGGRAAAAEPPKPRRRGLISRILRR